MKQIILYSLISVFLLACNEEDKLISTERPEFGYHVPQGNHDYDERIVDWKERCNFFILYDYLPRDIYWSVTGWNEASKLEEPMADVTWKTGLKAACADPDYVGLQLELIENSFLRFYPDTMLRRCMPLKVLLCRELYEVKNNGDHTFANVVSGYDYLAVNRGNADVTKMTDAEKKKFVTNINEIFLNRLIKNEKTLQNQEFFKGMNYTDDITIKTMYERGFVKNSKKQEEDWGNYLNVILSTSYETLIAEPKANDYTNKGILHPVKDKKGLIRKKYDILINHYQKNYGLNLQAIGNVAGN